MKCPHCTTTIHPDWHINNIYKTPAGHRMGGEQTHWRVQMMTCPSCKKDTLMLGQAFDSKLELLQQIKWTLVYPGGTNRNPVPDEVPSDVASDYKESAMVLHLSAKASAALSRRCLQSILREAGYTQRDLSQQIDAVLAEQDTRKALPTGVHAIVDAVRNFGNFSAHRITDQTTLQIIDVEPHEAEFCLDVLDSLFDHYYVRPKQAQRIKDELNKKLQAAKKPPAK